MDSAGRASVQDLLDLGMQARRRADHQAALEHFQSAAAAYPKNISAKLETARTLLRLSRAAEAEAIVRDVLAGNPHHVGALLALGQMLSTGDRGAEAESLLQRACDLAPDNARALRALASLIYHRGDGLRARALLDAAIAAGRIPAAAQIEIAAELRDLLPDCLGQHSPNPGPRLRAGAAGLRVFNHPRQCVHHGPVGVLHRKGKDLPRLRHHEEKLLMHRIAVVVCVLPEVLAQFPHAFLS